MDNVTENKNTEKKTRNNIMNNQQKRNKEKRNQQKCNKVTLRISFLFIVLLQSCYLLADEANVVKADIMLLENGQYRINTSVQHEDSGWEHYANAWEVLDEKGNVIDTRVLFHPHVNEQPFTRSLTLTIPSKVNIITIRAKDLVHGSGGKEIQLNVPKVK